VDVGVGGPNTDKAGLPLLVRTTIRDAFKKVGFIYMTGKKGSLQPTSSGPLDIHHAQVIAKYEEYKKSNPNYTMTQISVKKMFFSSTTPQMSPGVSTENI
jgi:hypothetical protein